MKISTQLKSSSKTLGKWGERHPLAYSAVPKVLLLMPKRLFEFHKKRKISRRRWIRFTRLS